jgi:hypothetical protein
LASKEIPFSTNGKSGAYRISRFENLMSPVTGQVGGGGLTEDEGVS